MRAARYPPHRRAHRRGTGGAAGGRVGRDLFPRGALPPSGAGGGAAGQNRHRPHDGRQRRDGFILSCKRDGPQRPGRHPAGARADCPPADRLHPQGGGGLLRAGGPPLCHRQHQPRRRLHPQPHPAPHRAADGAGECGLCQKRRCAQRHRPAGQRPARPACAAGTCSHPGERKPADFKPCGILQPAPGAADPHPAFAAAKGGGSGGFYAHPADAGKNQGGRSHRAKKGRHALLHSGQHPAG